MYKQNLRKSADKLSSK